MRQGETTTSVHVDTMTGQKELILATRFKVEDPDYWAKGQSSKPSVEILTPKARGLREGYLGPEQA